MKDKEIIEEEVKKVLKRHGCIVDDGYSNYEERLINGIVTVILTQLTLAEKRGSAYKGEAKQKAYQLGFKEGEEKARKEIINQIKQEMESNLFNLEPNNSVMSFARRFRDFLDSLEQSQEREEK